MFAEGSSCCWCPSSPPPPHHSQCTAGLTPAASSAFLCRMAFSCICIKQKGTDGKSTHTQTHPEALKRGSWKSVYTSPCPLLLGQNDFEVPSSSLPELGSGLKLQLFSVVICSMIILTWPPSLLFLPPLFSYWCFLGSLPK